MVIDCASGIGSNRCLLGDRSGFYGKECPSQGNAWIGSASVEIEDGSIPKSALESDAKILLDRLEDNLAH